MDQPTAPFSGIAFDNSYARLPERFGARVHPTPVAAPSLIALNTALAETLGLDPAALRSPAGIEWLAGNRPAAGSEPIAMAYAGHQFGNFVPQLGDGRALLLGELIDRDGRRRDLHLKGAGPTPFSRGGDGRSSIGPVVREYLASEAMAALGIPTTRALAAVATGETVLRQTGMEPGGILLRVAASHLRVGSFEYFASRGDVDGLQTLVEFALQRHAPERDDDPNPATALLETVIEHTAALVAHWMAVGFIHGVMNTDNTAISGETLDYGPFGFVDEFDPATCYSSIDRRGRYAWKNQPTIAHWNLTRLAECLLPLIDDQEARAIERANATLSRFPDACQTQFAERMTAKLGLPGGTTEDLQLAEGLLQAMHAGSADFTLAFRRLSDLGDEISGDDHPFRDLFREPAAVDPWLADWRARLAAAGRPEAERQAQMRRVNPAFILRNHLAQRVADAAVQRLDFEPLQTLSKVLSRPYDDQPEHADLARPPRPEERVVETFCGT
jgi:uncharacterized protein YdiU (UPF0061 family)